MSKTNPWLYAAAIVALTCLLAYAQVSDRPADVVLFNGKVVTVDRDFRVTDAVAIKNGKFVAVGTSDQMRRLAGTGTQVVDLRGRTVIPGLVDSHAHMDREGLKYLNVALTHTGRVTDPGVRSVADILKIIEREAKKKRPGEWIVTMPIGDYPFYGEPLTFLTDGRLPNRWDLDKVAPNNPVYIRSAWFYWSGRPPMVSVANSAALQLAGVTKDTRPPYELVEIVKDGNTGEPTGVFIDSGNPDTVEFTLMKVVPRFTREARVAALKLAMQKYHEAGVTSVFEGHGVEPDVLAAYRELWERGELTMRSYLVSSPTWDAAPDANVADLVRSWAPRAAPRGLGDDMLKIGSMFASLDSSAADSIRRKERPYNAWAGYGADQNLPPERASHADLVLAMAKADVRPVASASDPRLPFLAAYDQVNAQSSIAAKRFVLFHVSSMTNVQMEQVKRLGIALTTIPYIRITRDSPGRTQEELDTTFAPYKTLMERGIPIAFGSDNIPLAPFVNMWAAVSRRAPSGRVAGPHERLSRKDALIASTINGAWLTFEEKTKGSIEVGKLADLVVLETDLMTCPEDDIKNIKVAMTLVGGKTVYRSAALRDAAP